MQPDWDEEDRPQQLVFDGMTKIRRQFRGLTTSTSRLMPEWDEEREREWRDRSAVTHILTSHVIDEPCKMGKVHYGGCWHEPPEVDEFLAKLKEERYERLWKER